MLYWLKHKRLSIVTNIHAHFLKSYCHHPIKHTSVLSHLPSYCVPKGEGPLPEVGAILGQPVRKTKQALYIPRSTKIEEQLVPEGTYQLLH